MPTRISVEFFKKTLFLGVEFRFQRLLPELKRRETLSRRVEVPEAYFARFPVPSAGLGPFRR